MQPQDLGAWQEALVILSAVVGMATAHFYAFDALVDYKQDRFALALIDIVMSASLFMVATLYVMIFFGIVFQFRSGVILFLPMLPIIMALPKLRAIYFAKVQEEVTKDLMDEVRGDLLRELDEEVGQE